MSSRPAVHLQRRTRQEDATKRAENRAGMTPQERVDALDDRLGVGVGATRERARLDTSSEAPIEEGLPAMEPQKKKSKK